jgi:hypothetical protein
MSDLPSVSGSMVSGATAHLRRKGLAEFDDILRLVGMSPPPDDPRQVIAVALAGLELRALDAERGWARMRARRLYRVVNVLGAMVRRPWRFFDLLGDLRSAFEPRTVPYVEPKSAEMFLADLGEQPAPSKTRPLPYPHLRVAHAGQLSMFGMVASHFPVGTAEFEKGLEKGFDMLLVEPGVDDPVDKLDSATLDQIREAGIPMLWIVRSPTHLDDSRLGQADLVLAEDPDLADQASDRGLETLLIQPSVDDTIHNPIGWKQAPKNGLMVIADHPGIDNHLDTLIPAQDQISLYGPSLPGLEPAHHNPERPIGTNQAQQAKNHLAAYTTPQLTATPTSHTQLVLELTAAGTPVITPPDPTLDQLLDGHYLTATNSQELQAHLETLQHPPTRERHSIPARRHIHTHHTRKHRFEQILTHLDIPTNPTPRISILLATKRPDYIEHALQSVTSQNWENKELLLLLHGPENFDLPHIQQLTNQLPYPTHIIPCPDAWTLGDCLNTGLDHATGTYITKMDDDDHYGPNHLTDLTTAHTYSNADITGKWGNITYLEKENLTIDWHADKQEAFVTHIPGATMLMKRSLLSRYRLSRVSQGEDSLLFRSVSRDGGDLYSTHRFNFVRVRHGDHSFARSNAEFLADSSGQLRVGLDLERSSL